MKEQNRYRRLSYAITGLEKIAGKANKYERRASEEGRRSGAKSYRDVSAEERQAVEGSATAWAGVLQNDVKPSSKPKQKAKQVDKSRQLNLPSGIIEGNTCSYGNKPVQQQEEKPADTAEENVPAYGSDVAKNVARMANGGNREAWLDKNYQTESGKPINEAEEREFIIKPNGDKNFGEISQEIETKTNGVVKAAPIRLQVGNEHFGYIHLLKHA